MTRLKIINTIQAVGRCTRSQSNNIFFSQKDVFFSHVNKTVIMRYCIQVTENQCTHHLHKSLLATMSIYNITETIAQYCFYEIRERYTTMNWQNCATYRPDQSKMYQPFFCSALEGGGGMKYKYSIQLLCINNVI